MTSRKFVSIAFDTGYYIARISAENLRNLSQNTTHTHIDIVEWIYMYMCVRFMALSNDDA